MCNVGEEIRVLEGGGGDCSSSLQSLAADQAARAGGVNTAVVESPQLPCPSCGWDMQVCVTPSYFAVRYKLIKVCAKCGVCSDGIAPEELFARLAAAEAEVERLKAESREQRAESPEGKLSTPCIEQIVISFLKCNGFDGLYQPGECACDLENFMPCGELLGTCTAGYRAPGDSECGFYIADSKPTEGTDNG